MNACPDLNQRVERRLRAAGAEVWNTLAHLGDCGMLVTRTHPEAPKHKGMTYFAVDMHSPGVEVRPLRQITGEAEFNEVYLTDVRVPDENRIGAAGEGWRVARTTIMNERTAIGDGEGGGDHVLRGGSANHAVEIWKGLAPHVRTLASRDAPMPLWVRGEVQHRSIHRMRRRPRLATPLRAVRSPSWRWPS